MSIVKLLCLTACSGALFAWPAVIAVAAEGTGAVGGQLRPERLRTEYLCNPLGVDAAAPRLYWQVVSEARAQKQSAYHILTASVPELLVPGKADLWDSGKVDSDETTHIAYAGKPLSSGQRCYWTVRVWDAEGLVSAWAEPAFWSMGLLRPEDWSAQWISWEDPREISAGREELTLPPARYFRKDFQVQGPVRRALLRVSALGICDPHLNGRRVTESRFTPGWTDYRKRVHYHTFDVSEQLREGANALGAILADGWYSGYLGYGLLVGYGPNKCGRYFYGKTPSLMMQLSVEYENGAVEHVVTDASWRVGLGAYLEADLLMGETLDARKTPMGWDEPGFAADDWAEAIPAEENGALLATYHDAGGVKEVDLGFKAPERVEAYPMEPVLPTQTLNPVKILKKDEGRYLVDFGQNFAGVVRLRAEGPAGTAIVLRYGEMLHPDGRLMTENLRRARATDTWILRGDAGGETYEPRFTFHGFQYAEIEHYPGELKAEDVVGVVLHNDTELVSHWESNDPVLNRFFQNVVWTQRSNFLEIPTDCPQRDERFGWTGDAQVYARAAAYNADVAAFFTKWLKDLRDAQGPEGAYPDYAPYAMQHGGSGKPYGTAWTDAGVIVPWAAYTAYGDLRMLREHYESVRRFIAFRRGESPNHGGTNLGNGWGDWLAMGEETPIPFIDHCYYAGSLRLAAAMADALGETGDAEEYRAVLDKVKDAFVATYVKEDGRLAVDTQTAYVLAIDMGMLPEDRIEAAAARLEEKIVKNDRRMTTGFLGTRPLLPTLTATGRFELAVELMQSRRFPSWGYEVMQGATTVWERWNSYTIDDGFQEGMNSFNHYAFGAVAEWMIGALAGIEPAAPGYREIFIRPRVPLETPTQEAPRLDHIKARHVCMRGLIESEWRRDGDAFTLEVVIPANTEATIVIPAAATAPVLVDDRDVVDSSLISVLTREARETALRVPSGRYRFAATLPQLEQ